MHKPFRVFDPNGSIRETGHQLNFMLTRSASGAWKHGFYFRGENSTPKIPGTKTIVGEVVFAEHPNFSSPSVR